MAVPIDLAIFFGSQLNPADSKHRHNSGKDLRISYKNSWTNGKEVMLLQACPCQPALLLPLENILELSLPAPSMDTVPGLQPLGLPWAFPGARDHLSLGLFTLSPETWIRKLRSHCVLAGSLPLPICWPCVSQSPAQAC